MIVRKLWPWEWDQHRAHLLRLGPEDRRLRFCRPASDDDIHRYCTRIDRMHTTLIGCVCDGTLRGVAELVQSPGDTRPGAEIALSVERHHQCLGIGTQLLRRALLLAQNRFCDTVFLLSLRENRRLRRLAARFGAQITASDDTAESHIRLPWPSCLSLFEEAAGDGRAVVAAVFELPARQLAAAAERVFPERA